MAAAELLPVAGTLATSADIVVAAGSQVTVSLKDAAGPDIVQGAVVQIQLKGDNSQYFTVDTLRTAEPAKVISAPGTYRLRRPAGATVGAFSG